MNSSDRMSLISADVQPATDDDLDFIAEVVASASDNLDLNLPNRIYDIAKLRNRTDIEN